MKYKNKQVKLKWNTKKRISYSIRTYLLLHTLTGRESESEREREGERLKQRQGERERELHVFTKYRLFEIDLIF